MQKGSLKIIKDRRGVKVWRGQWRENGKGRTQLLGRYIDVTRAHARAELDSIVTAVNGRAVEPGTSRTLEQFTTNEYLTVKSNVWKPSTASTTEHLINCYIFRDLGKRPIAGITRAELQAHLNRKAEAGLSRSIVGHIRWQLKAIFGMAVGDGLVQVDPTSGLVLPRCKKAPDKRVIGIDDFRRAQMALEPRERLVLRLAGAEGMRPGEIVGLQVGDIEGTMIHVKRRMYAGKVDDPKNVRSTRLIPLTKGSRALLAQYLAITGETRPDAWLFPSETGITPVSYSNIFQDRIRPALKEIGLGHVSFQILRRSCVTGMSKVMDVDTRARIAGHTTDVSQNVYRQSDIDTMEESMGKWSDLIQ